MRQMAGVGGDIEIRLTPEGARIAAVEILSTRPRQAARIFEGKPADTMCATIGRVFSLCGKAQTVAALTAVEQALGIARDPSVAAARDAVRRAEMLTQVVTRLALHWPRALGLPLAPEAVRAAMAAENVIESVVLGAGWRKPGAGLVGGPVDIVAAQIDIEALVAPLAAALVARGWEAYGALPEGAAPEHGVFATYWDAPAVAQARAAHGAGLAARLAAAEVALTVLPGEIATDLAGLRPSPTRPAERDAGHAVATVETARGPLSHLVRIEAGQVKTCRTEAPTEMNFTDDGPVAAGLVGAAADPVAAELHVLAIDPCVAARVELAPG
ncbi:MAG: hypothetical protein KDK53_05950 [Maritimibacter sp.]|nr:hypothetical protein [Maritimibacter sp.]